MLTQFTVGESGRPKVKELHLMRVLLLARTVYRALRQHKPSVCEGYVKESEPNWHL